MSKLKDRVVVITGASGGIGAATAEEAARRGANVVLVARREDALRTVAAKCGADAFVLVADVTSRDQVRRVVSNISSMLGRIPFATIRSAYNGAKHYLNALTANFRTEVQATHPGIQFTIVSPGVVRTDFGLHARHGGPDSRSLPESQSAEEVATVIVDAVEWRNPDVYTRKGAHDRVAGFYASIGTDPS